MVGELRLRCGSRVDSPPIVSWELFIPECSPWDIELLTLNNVIPLKHSEMVIEMCRQTPPTTHHLSTVLLFCLFIIQLRGHQVLPAPPPSSTGLTWVAPCPETPPLVWLSRSAKHFLFPCLFFIFWWLDGGQWAVNLRWLLQCWYCRQSGPGLFVFCWEISWDVGAPLDWHNAILIIVKWRHQGVVLHSPGQWGSGSSSGVELQSYNPAI